MLDFLAILILVVVMSSATNILSVIICMNLVLLTFLYVGRLHDIGYSGWLTLPIMVTSLLGMIILGSMSGKKEANKYGSVPPRELKHVLAFWHAQTK